MDGPFKVHTSQETRNSITLNKMKKHLSSIANDLIQKCAQEVGTSLDALVEEFESGLKDEVSDYSRKLVEFCSSKALGKICGQLEEMIGDGSVDRFTFDMMLAWETPTPIDEESKLECVAKEREDPKPSLNMLAAEQQDDVPLFYSDLMPLLQVDDQQSVGEDAFVWLASLLPLVADVVNARFMFEALTASTTNRLYYPAYDIFIKEIDKNIKYLEKQATPTGVQLRDDEFILHVDGTRSTQRVIRHVGATSWPGRLTLTNYALYFEVSGVIKYENALRIDLSRQDVDHKVSSASTGPWGAPLFDKAMAYESSQLSESIVLEFPEMTSSSRRDYWIALTKEVILLHNFLSRFSIKSPEEIWEMHCRTMLGIYRLHAARELLRISQPPPNNFLIFSLYDELPKGDYVLEELANSLKQMNRANFCIATSILGSLNISHPSLCVLKHKEENEEPLGNQIDNLTSLETTISQARQEAEEVYIAKANAEKLKEEGLSDSVMILMELLSPINDVLSVIRVIIKWERPAITLIALCMILSVIYKEWIGYAISAILLYGVAKMLWARHWGGDKCAQVVVDTSSDQTTMECIVNAQHGLSNFHGLVQTVNISIMKMWSILFSRAPKHANQVMLVILGASALFALIPFKFILMAVTCLCFAMNSPVGKHTKNEQSNRRWKEWWNSIPVVPVRIIDRSS